MWSRWCYGRHRTLRARGAGIEGVWGARRRVVIDAFVALVRACSGPLLMVGKIPLLPTLVPSSLLVDLVLTQVCSQLPRLLYSHSMGPLPSSKGQ